MDYCKVEVSIEPLQNWFADTLISQLGEIGYESFVETEKGFEAYVPFKKFSEETLKITLKKVKGKFSINYQLERIAEQNWNEVWEKNYFKPLVINNICLIRAPFHKNYPTCPIEIIIEPNMAFGTGNHETTSLMVETILEEKIKEKTVLDMGCGTGILSILASKLGALKITAIDIDSWSFEGTTENSELNNCTNIQAKHGDAGLLGKEKYDFVFANIHKNVLIQDMQAYADSLEKEGKIFVSGFYTKDIPAIIKSAENSGLTPLSYQVKNDWVVHSFSK